MRGRQFREVLRTASIGVLVLALAVAQVVIFGRAKEFDREGRGLPGQRFETTPGYGGEPREGPDSAADQAFFQRAFPDADIPVTRIEFARQSFGRVQAKGFPRGKRPGTWVTVGPSNAIYPFFALRDFTTYVPNEYVAGGRTTALALAPDCGPGSCRLYAATSGGGVWRTDDALAPEPRWMYLSYAFQGNAVGSVALDPNDPSGNTVWVGTGEGNTCGSGCVAGVGIYKSTDGGRTWTGPLGKAAFNARGVGSIAVKPGDPNTIYAGSSFAVAGLASVCCYPANSPYRATIPGAPKWGLYKSTDGGQTWAFIHNGDTTTAFCTGDSNEANNGSPCSPRGVRQVVIDPSNPEIVYATSYARGVWRSADSGTTWVQIKPSLNAGISTTRAAIAVTTLGNGKTRMYVAEGHTSAKVSGIRQYSRLFRGDNVASGVPDFADLTSKSPADLGFGSYDFCGGQCWYDNFVMTPAGRPDIVYLLGSYQYGETGEISNGRGVLLSTDAGVSFTDMTMDATSPVNPNGIHPDQHALVVNPSNPYQFIEASDGGIIRSSGDLRNISANCASRDLPPARLGRCRQLLSRVPGELQSLNKGLTTLQFQSLSVSPFDATLLQGGTQDNGTWQNVNTVKWLQSMVGDGGQSGFDVANPHVRFHTYFSSQVDINFFDGAVAEWNYIGSPMFTFEGPTEPALFYVPIISDPRVSGTIYLGASHVWRTKTNGLGSVPLAELRLRCNQWTGDAQDIVGETGIPFTCGDWAKLGDPGDAGQLTSGSYGSTRAAGAVAAVERARSNTSTLWAATTTGRVFVSTNANAEPAAAVTFTRIDTPATPGRFVSGIYIDPANANRAWISFSGFNAATPSTPGHVFEVTYNPGSGTAQWADRSFDLQDIPITGLVRDDLTGDLYASSDFGVLKLEFGQDPREWRLAAPGMPRVSVAGLTIAPAARKLYAATHGLGAWLLDLSDQTP
jgi:hypothetical protein